MGIRKREDYPSPFKGGDDNQPHDERIGEICHDVERDEGGPTHDRSGAQTPRQEKPVDGGEADPGER